MRHLSFSIGVAPVKVVAIERWARKSIDDLPSPPAGRFASSEVDRQEKRESPLPMDGQDARVGDGKLDSKSGSNGGTAGGRRPTPLQISEEDKNH